MQKLLRKIRNEKMLPKPAGAIDKIKSAIKQVEKIKNKLKSQEYICIQLELIEKHLQHAINCICNETEERKAFRIAKYKILLRPRRKNIKKS